MFETTKAELKKIINSKKTASAWQKGVKDYALDLIDSIDAGDNEKISYGELEKRMLNGAKDWKQYSEGGLALIYDSDIADRLCTPSELKKTKNGQLNPNKSETWLDTQARALYQAAKMIKNAALPL